MSLSQENNKNRCFSENSNFNVNTEIVQNRGITPLDWNKQAFEMQTARDNITDSATTFQKNSNFGVFLEFCFFFAVGC
jgi:hypothetical protein